MSAAVLHRKPGTHLPTASYKRSSHCLSRVVARGYRHGADRPVLQLHNRQELTLDDVRDAYEVCSLIPAPEERAQCYSVFGLDGIRMSQYYETVLQLEARLEGAPQFAGQEYDPDDTYWTAQASVSE